MADAMTEMGQLADLDLIVYESLIAPPGLSVEALSQSLEYPPAEVAASLERLLELRLVRRGSDGTHLAVNPSLAESQALGGEELELNTRRSLLESRRNAILKVAPQWAAAMRKSLPANAVDIVYDPEAMTNVVMHFAETSSREIRSTMPGSAQLQMNQRARNVNIHTLSRGVRIRSIYQDGILRDRRKTAQLQELGEYGAQVRLCPSVVSRLIVIDSDIALLPLALSEARYGLAVVREPHVVAWLTATFEALWRESTPLDEALGSHQAMPAVDQTRATILRLMGEGEKDEAISRRLSISVRTCRRHIADYMTQVGATSRFQAGVIAAREGHLGVVPPP